MNLETAVGRAELSDSLLTVVMATAVSHAKRSQRIATRHQVRRAVVEEPLRPRHILPDRSRNLRVVLQQVQQATFFERRRGGSRTAPTQCLVRRLAQAGYCGGVLRVL